jgi:hypothetical protein
MHKPQAVKTLPQNYEPRGTLDASKNKTVVVGLNAAAVVLFFLFGWFALRILTVVHPDLESGELRNFNWVTVVLLLLIPIILHELVHGFFFWLFTRERPKFGFKGPYAYAAAPDWYLPRNQHLVVGLAPFVLITLAGLLLLIVSPATISALLLAVVANAGGAAGDILVACWLLTQPRTTLVHDAGDAISIYRPV